MFETLIYWAICLLFVIALILGLALIVKKFALPQNARSPLFGKSKKARLQVIETLAIDHKSRLVLLRRDDVEHLIIVGPTHETLIESGIKNSPGSPHTKAPEQNKTYPVSSSENLQKTTHHEQQPLNDTQKNSSLFDDAGNSADSGGDGGD